MSKSYWGSINVTELVNALNQKHSAFVKAGQSKNIFAAVTLWENDKPDQYGNTHSLHLNAAKGSDDANIYISNLKPTTVKLTDADSINLDADYYSDLAKGEGV